MTENKNTFDLDKMNNSLLVATLDTSSADIADDGFKILSDCANRHATIEESNFGDLKKGQILGLIIDDISDNILDDSRFKELEIKK